MSASRGRRGRLEGVEFVLGRVASARRVRLERGRARLHEIERVLNDVCSRPRRSLDADTYTPHRSLAGRRSVYSAPATRTQRLQPVLIASSSLDGHARSRYTCGTSEPQAVYFQTFFFCEERRSTPCGGCSASSTWSITRHQRDEALDLSKTRSRACWRVRVATTSSG